MYVCMYLCIDVSYVCMHACMHVRMYGPFLTPCHLRVLWGSAIPPCLDGKTLEQSESPLKLLQTLTTENIRNKSIQIQGYILNEFSDLNDAKETTQQQVHKTHIWHLKKAPRLMTPSARVPTHMPLLLEVRTPIIAAAMWAKKRNKANLIPKPSKCPNFRQINYISFFDLIHPVPPKKKKVAWIRRSIQDHLGAIFKKWWNLKH